MFIVDSGAALIRLMEDRERRIAIRLEAQSHVPVLFRRSYEIPNPYAGTYKREVLDLIMLRNRIYQDYGALFMLREQVWCTEIKLELKERGWESREWREEQKKKLVRLRIPYTENTRAARNKTQ